MSKMDRYPTTDLRAEGGADLFDYIFKLIVVGDSGVGKSSLTARLTEDQFFKDCSPTVAIDFRMCHMWVGEKSVRLQIWDTAGQERFSAVASSFYRGANGVLLCFSLADLDSFHSVESWLERVCEHAVDGTPYVLVGCKSDLQRCMDRADAEEWVRKHRDKGVQGYVETSARTDTGVKEAFEMLVRRIMDAWEGQERRRREDLAQLASQMHASGSFGRKSQLKVVNATAGKDGAGSRRCSC